MMSLVNPVNTSYCLEKICESNYQKLLKLVPDLFILKDTSIGIARHTPTLHLIVIAVAPYTMTIKLTHRFKKEKDLLDEPAVLICIYLDLKLAEVLNHHGRRCVAQAFNTPSLSHEIMDYKWRLNYFLQKWLDHCLSREYQFNS
jgi:uncharacterized protein YqiB (DUF1249 family)